MTQEVISHPTPRTQESFHVYAHAHVTGGHSIHFDTEELLRAYRHLLLQSEKYRAIHSTIRTARSSLISTAQKFYAALHTESAHSSPRLGHYVNMSIHLQKYLIKLSHIEERSLFLSRQCEHLSHSVKGSYNLYSSAENFMENFLFSLSSAGGALLASLYGPHHESPPYTSPSSPFLDTQKEKYSGDKYDTSHAHSSFIGVLTSLLNPLVTSISALLQGHTLSVTPWKPDTRLLSRPSTISDALFNLYDLSNLAPYGTVAIQKFRTPFSQISSHSSGKQPSFHWVIYIPGTSSHINSPLFWTQNNEVMSHNNTVRMQAASTKLVLEAMKKSGIKPTDSITLVGHSQGGIVGASIASSGSYPVRHLITAGSPIGNHPIPPSVKVTSIENDKEIVSSLDGVRNPSASHWVTVRGSFSKASPTPTYPSEFYAHHKTLEEHKNKNISKLLQGNPVYHTHSSKELTHGINYHQSLWDNALALKNESALNHDHIFNQTVQGELLSTEYYTGRLHKETHKKSA